MLILRASLPIPRSTTTAAVTSICRILADTEHIPRSKSIIFGKLYFCTQIEKCMEIKRY